MAALPPLPPSSPDPPVNPSSSYPISFATMLTQPTQQDRPNTGKHRGSPAIFFSKSQIESLSRPFNHALIGKFSQGRPDMEFLRKFIDAQDFKGPFSAGLLDQRHVLIRFKEEVDFIRMYSRSIWYVSGKPMRVFKWTPNFHVDRESSSIPFWFMLPKLPVHFFEKKMLMEIAGQIGTPLRLDTATLDIKRPSTARIQIEVNVSKTIPDKIWIGLEGESEGCFWQSIIPDSDLPSTVPTAGIRSCRK